MAIKIYQTVVVAVVISSAPAMVFLRSNRAVEPDPLSPPTLVLSLACSHPLLMGNLSQISGQIGSLSSLPFKLAITKVCEGIRSSISNIEVLAANILDCLYCRMSATDTRNYDMKGLAFEV
jgi:hypothetical protein